MIFEFPYNKDLERYILGCLILDRQDYILKLTENDFYDATNCLIYKVLKYLCEKKINIDMVTVADYAAKRIENAIIVISEICNVPTTASFEHNLENLKMYSTKRDLMKKAIEIQEMIINSEHINAIDLKNDVLQSFDTVTVTENNKKKTDIASIMEEALLDIEDRYNSTEEHKLFTGYLDIDKLTGGLNKQEMTIIAARPGVGKTAFALQLMLHLAKKNNHCTFISREMSNVQIAKRLLSNVATLHNQKLKLCKNIKDEDWETIGKGATLLSSLPIEINDKLGTIQEIRAYCREKKNKGQLDVLIIDYIGLLKTLKKCSSRREEIDDISRQLKELSLEFEIPVVVLSQLNREGAKQNREPEIFDLKESGSIEQDADNVWLLYMSDEEEAKEKGKTQKLKVIIAKQRNGPTGSIYLHYVSTNFRYYDISYR